MQKTRAVETNEGIQDKENVNKYEASQRNQKDMGYFQPFIDEVISNEINSGLVLEIGPGPGYFGLEWLTQTKNSQLIGVDISQNMIQQAEQNAKAYSLEQRAKYVLGDATKLVFEDDKFDYVISSFSLHEWSDPVMVFKEIGRVLKPGGVVYIMDLRRDADERILQHILKSVPEKEMQEGFMNSINASYIKEEIEDILSKQDALEMKQFNTHEFKTSFICKKQ